MGDKYWKLGIIGWPLGYSLSPVMHTAALKACGLEGEYREIKVKPEELEGWLGGEALKLDGFNVTMPHKEAVYQWLVEHPQLGELASDLEKNIEAVNTVAIRNKRLAGYNTDALGFALTLADPPISLEGDPVVILGAGGAARAVAFALLKKRVSRLVIWNRPGGLQRAERLSAKLNELAKDSKFSTVTSNMEALPVSDAKLVVNTTPLGMEGVHAEGVSLHPIFEKLHRGQLIYDLVYKPVETPLILEAQQKGCSTISGWQMLAAQGSRAFDIWIGIRVAKDGRPIRKVIREALIGELSATS